MTQCLVADFVVTWPGFQLDYFQAVRLQASYLASLSLSLPICQMEIKYSKLSKLSQNYV